MREFRAAERIGMRIARSLHDYARGEIAEAYLYIGLHDTFERIRGIAANGWTWTDGNAGFGMAWRVDSDEPVYVKIAGGT